MKTRIKRAAAWTALLALAMSFFVLPAHAEEEGRELLVLMYHQLLPGGKSKYVVSPETLENDLILLKENGYVSVTAKEVIAYVKEEGELPEKPVMITFDDGHYNAYYYGKDILQKHGFTALISIIGRYSENTTATGTGGHVHYSYLTWEEIGEVADSGVFELGNHSYDMHNFSPRFGAKQKQGESDEEYRRALRGDTEKLQGVLEEKCGVRPRVYAVPFGSYNALTKTVLAEEGFAMMLTCNEGKTRLERGNGECLFRVRRYNRGSAADLAKWI